MKFIVSVFCTGFFACGLVSTATAEIVSADGFGDSASAAITNAAVNAIRTVAGSRMTVKQEFTSETVNSVPNERLIEKILEVSNGSVKHLQVVSVKPVGDIFQASVTVDVDPGKLERQTSSAGHVEIKPGTFAGSVAQAQLSKDAGAQIQDAFTDYLSIASKKLEILSIGAEQDERIVDVMRTSGLLEKDQIPIKVLLKVSTDSAVVSELKKALYEGSKEVRTEIDNQRWASGALESTYTCNKNSPPQDTVQIVILDDKDNEADVGTVYCGSARGVNFHTNVTGAPSIIYSVDDIIDIAKAFESSNIHVRLLEGKNELEKIDIQIDSENGSALQEGSVIAFLATGDGKSIISDSFDQYRRDGLNPLGSEAKFSPTFLIGQHYSSNPSDVIITPSMSYAFTFAIPSNVATKMDAATAEITVP